MNENDSQTQQQNDTVVIEKKVADGSVSVTLRHNQPISNLSAGQVNALLAYIVTQDTYIAHMQYELTEHERDKALSQLAVGVLNDQIAEIRQALRTGHFEHAFTLVGDK